MEQVYPEIGEGERITGEGELGVTLLADIEQLGAVEVRSAPGGVAPPLHVHAQHAEAFFVFEGELTFRLEDGEHRAERETWVFVPPEVVHTFAVTGDEHARFLDLHVPSFEFGNFVRSMHAAESEDELRAARAAFDQQPTPEHAAGDPGLVILCRTGGTGGVGSTEPPKSAGAGFAGAGAGIGETITDRPRRRATLLVDADELIVSEFSYGPGERGAEPHIHHHHADGFLVVEGEFTFTLRDGPLVIPAATFLLIPPGVVHGFDNDGTANARCFNLHAPSLGFGDYLRGQNPDFDQHDPPEDGGVDPASVISVRLGLVNAVTWEELVADMIARHPLEESKMFGMPCLKREDGKVVAGYWKDGGLTVKLTDESAREQALAIPGIELFDPGMGRVMREWVHVPAAQSGEWERLVEQAIG